MLFRALALSLLPLLLFACAKEQKSQDQNNGIFSIDVTNLKEAQDISRDAEVTCPSSGPCNPSVGLLSFASPDHAAQCTASLLTDDIAVTNSHCIPADLKEPGSSCQDRIWLHFASDADQPNWKTTIECDSVLFDSKASGAPTSPDYAYIKLKQKSLRPVLHFSREGIVGGEEYHLQKVNPVRSKGNLRGIQENVACRPVYSSYVLESFFNPFANVALLTDCLVIPGNSGSPVIAADGSVHGVVFAVLNIDETLDTAGKDPNVVIKESATHLNIASNFACLESPLDSNLPGACASLSSDYAQYASSASQEMINEIDLKVQKEMGSGSDFQWHAWFDKEHSKGTFGFAGIKLTPAPQCVKAEALSRYLNRDFSLARPHWVVREEYDRVMKGELALSLEATSQDEIKVVPAGANHYYAILTSEGSSITVDLPVCP